jgi:hypothetical protein
MKILFDHGTPAPLRRALSTHVVRRSAEMGWAELDNGVLLKSANEQFDALITTDQSMRHQQNLAPYRLAILVLPTTNWRIIRNHLAQVAAAVDVLQPGEVVVMEFTAST